MHLSVCMCVCACLCVCVSPECWIGICAYTFAVEPATVALLALNTRKIRKKLKSEGTDEREREEKRREEKRREEEKID